MLSEKKSDHRRESDYDNIWFCDEELIWPGQRKWSEYFFFFIYISNVNKVKINSTRKWAKEMCEAQNKVSWEKEERKWKWEAEAELVKACR